MVSGVALVWASELREEDEANDHDKREQGRDVDVAELLASHCSHDLAHFRIGACLRLSRSDPAQKNPPKDRVRRQISVGARCQPYLRK
jgi:hypothetical protein